MNATYKNNSEMTLVQHGDTFLKDMTQFSVTLDI